ncbi:MAG: hypothetical protein AAGH81_19530, partial [Bacteroidota bacterium]
MIVSIKKHLLWALFYFLLATSLGLLLRFYLIHPVPFPYKYLVHAHSHIALLGWVYLALTSIIYGLYFNTVANGKKYRYLFWFTQLTLIGMLVTFPFQGYGLFSIIFSTLFLLASYWFFWLFATLSGSELKGTPAFICIRMGLWYMVLSSLGPWALGAIMNTLGPSSPWYRMAIYFYLHFQYNAWMMMALLGIFLLVLDQNGHVIQKLIFTKIFWCLNMGIVLSFFLSSLWTKPPWPFYVLGIFGAVLQLVAFFLLLKWLLPAYRGKGTTKEFTGMGLTLFSLIALKLVLQLASGFPFVAELASTILDFTIGYLHLVFLGVITPAILMLAKKLEWLTISKWAIRIYLLGFFGSEFLIFYRGFAAWLGGEPIPRHTSLLAGVSGFVLVGLWGILFKNMGLRGRGVD